MFSLFTLGVGLAQEIESEIDFKYVKAKYLLGTERYEEAIKAFTVIIKENPKYADATILRAEAKYAMAAYKGTKKDVLIYIDNKGVTKTAIILLGKAEYRMKNYEAAINSLTLATRLNTDDAQVWEYVGNIHKENGKLLKACEFWQTAAKMGSSKARIKSKKTCGNTEPTEPEKDKVIPSSRKKTKAKIESLPSSKHRQTEDTKEEKSEEEKKMKDNRTPDQIRRDNDDSLKNPTNGTKIGDATNDDNIKIEDKTKKEDDKKVETPEIEEPSTKDEDDSGSMPDEDDFKNVIKVDNDLTLIIKGQGLGRRNVLKQPNILIMANEGGTVAIDICVNKRGKVVSAEFNGQLSTKARKSLVSLAIRKSKDFWFGKSDYKEQCGLILFEIKGN